MAQGIRFSYRASVKRVTASVPAVTRTFPGGNGQGQRHGKPAALPFLTLNLDPAPHAVHQILHDGHAQAGALDLVDRAAAHPLEGHEYPLQELLAHAHAVVLAEEVQPNPALSGQPLGKADQDGAAFLGIFHRVADDVYQNLPQAEGVPHQVLLLNPADLEGQLLPLLLRLGAEDHSQIMNQVRQGKPLLTEGHPPAVNPGHIQDVVDQAHQMGGGRADLFQAVLHPSLFVNMAQANGRHAHDGVHGRTDIVRHVGEKPAFGLVGGLRRRQSLLHRLVLPLQLLNPPDPAAVVNCFHPHATPPIGFFIHQQIAPNQRRVYCTISFRKMP